MQRGGLTITANSVADDVVVADGDLAVKGRVTGSVFVVNGDVLISPGAVVEGNLTVLAGNLTMSGGAGVSGEINVFSGKAVIDEGANVGSQVRALEEVSSLTDEKLALISRYIIFSREVAPASLNPSGLGQLDLGELRLRKDREQETDTLYLYELGKTRLDPQAVDEAGEVVYRGRDIRARVYIIRFSSEGETEKFWDGLRDKYEDKTRYSVHNSLGHGAHWYFRHEGSSYCFWYKGRTFQAVVVRHDDDDPERDEWERVEEVRDGIIDELGKLYMREDK